MTPGALKDIKRAPKPKAKAAKKRLSPMASILNSIPTPFMRKFKVSAGVSEEEAIKEAAGKDPRPFDKASYDHEKGIVTMYRAPRAEEPD